MALNKLVALAGGVGGAKLAAGLARVLPPGALTVIVNVGDDFQHYGLHISPDLDTVMYTLAGINNQETGWGLAGESWQMLAMLERYGQQPWFRLGDQDLATHLLRSYALQQGQSLTQITQQMAQALGITQHLLPATDARWATMVDTVELGTLPFQEYFVRQRWQPTVRQIWYDGDAAAAPTTTVLSALTSAEAVIICPSNPLLSIDPILSLGDMRKHLRNRQGPCVAVSPLLHGQAVKGPAQKLMQELGLEASTSGIARYYEGLIDGLVVDHGDAPTTGEFMETNILMPTPEAQTRLAQEVLQWIEVLR